MDKMNAEKKPMIVLAGPTAVGKTALSLRLARSVGGEIVSADSMQVYRHMDIGTAKASPMERAAVPHHLIDCCEPDEEYNVAFFQRDARAAVAEIYDRGHIPVVTGGTGFYIQALTRDIDFTDAGGDPHFREELERRAAAEGGEVLYEELMRTDPEACREIHPHNTKRIVRALEYYHDTGEKISEHNRRESRRVSPYNLLYLVLNRDRTELYRRIDARVDDMLRQGLVEEVRALHDRGYTRDMVSMQGLGYKEILEALDGAYTLEEAVVRLKRDTRHYAKRQITWFKREPEAVWLSWEDYPAEEAMLERILTICRSREIL